MRSNSLSTKGCGERMQTVSFVEVRFVVTVRQIIENWPKGQVLWCCCSRTVTDTYDAWPGVLPLAKYQLCAQQHGHHRVAECGRIYPCLPAYHGRRRQSCPDPYQRAGLCPGR